jgi:pre-mRNA-splicing factor ATP-dependent RNA helicase DHX15/PRP43
MTGSTKHPLFGFVPRRVTARQVRGAIVRGVITILRSVLLTPPQDGKENPFTRLPHSDQYHKILEARKKLPVFAKMDDFYQLVSSAPPSVSEGASFLEPRPYVANSPEKYTKHQILIVVGETGSGKTTQCVHTSYFNATA